MSRVAATAVILALSAVPALAHPTGVCVPTERCEDWSATYDDPAVPAGSQSNQYVRAVLANETTVFTVVRSVGFLPSAPAESTATANVVAYDRVTGAVRWTARQQQGWYNTPEHAALSPDGATLYVTGTSFDDSPFAWTDTHVVTTAYATDTGAMRWSKAWNGRTDVRENPNGIAVAPDGSEVYVVGVAADGSGSNWDFLTVAYGADGNELWSRTYGTAEENDEPLDVAVSPGGDVLAVTGSTGGITRLHDYTTVAYSLRGRGGQQLWAASYDFAGRSDSATGVAADAGRFYVTGSSDTPAGVDYATVAYDVRTGAQEWVTRWPGGSRYNTAIDVATANGRVVVTGRAEGLSGDEEFDAGTVGYDAATGRELWAARFAPARHDGSPAGLVLSPDGATAYVVTTEWLYLTVGVTHRLGLVAYDVATGTERWHTFLDGRGGSLSGAGVAVGGGTVAVAGDVATWDSNDALTAVFPE